MTLQKRLGTCFWALAAAALLAAPGSSQTTTQVAGGRLSVLSLGGDRNVKVEVVGDATRLFGFPGIADGTTFAGLSGVTLVTGAGSDQVEFDLQTSLSFDVRVDTGAGPSTTKVKWKILSGGTAPAAGFELAGGAAGEQILAYELDSESQYAAVSINSGAVTEIAAKVSSSAPSDFLRVSFSATATKTSFEVGSNASALEVNVQGGPTGAADELNYKINQARPAEVAVQWAIDSGAGSDKIEASVAAAGSNVVQKGSVLARGGDDLVAFDTDAFRTVTGLTLNGGPGADNLAQIIRGRFQASQTLQTVMAGGDGDDQLVLTTDTGIFGSGLPNDLFPIINCGAGFDQFNAFGSIRGCEARH